MLNVIFVNEYWFGFGRVLDVVLDMYLGIGNKVCDIDLSFIGGLFI